MVKLLQTIVSLGADWIQSGWYLQLYILTDRQALCNEIQSRLQAKQATGFADQHLVDDPIAVACSSFLPVACSL